MKLISLAAIAAFSLAGAVSAATITATDAGAVIATPAAILDDAPTNTQIQAFGEAVDFMLTADLTTDDGALITAGTRVDSHMIFLNSAGNTRIIDTETFTFSEKILGVLFAQNGSSLFDTDATLGAPVDYSNTAGYGGNRGLEDNDARDFANITSMFTLDVGMQVTEPGDWIRVITVSSVPLPAGAFLLPVALGGLAMMRRRKAKS